jgi:hypothetical protein
MREARLQPHSNTYGLYGTSSTNSFSLSTMLVPCQCHSTNAPYSYSIGIIIDIHINIILNMFLYLFNTNTGTYYYSIGTLTLNIAFLTHKTVLSDLHEQGAWFSIVAISKCTLNTSYKICIIVWMWSFMALENGNLATGWVTLVLINLFHARNFHQN